MAEVKGKKAEKIPDYADAPVWPPVPEEGERQYVAIEDLDEETAAAVRAAVRERGEIPLPGDEAE